MIELKPCPFCGGAAYMRRISYRMDWYYCYCTVCGISQPTKKYQWASDAADAWNRRVKNE